MPFAAVAECPDVLLGNLESSAGKYNPWVSEDLKAIPIALGQAHDEKVVNGVVLPQRVYEELQRLGHALFSYTSGQLEDAIQACHFDGQLVDDPDGITFHDMLTLTHEEEKASKGLGTGEPHRKNMRHVRESVFGPHTFCDDVEHEREEPRIPCHLHHN